MSSARDVPTTASVLATLIGVTWRRLLRGRAFWVVLAIAALPVILAAALQGDREVDEATAVVELIIMCLLPSVFIASSVGEEIEDRTTTYLWSRPLARWTIVVGKFLALAPIAALLIVASWMVAIQAGTAAWPSLQSTLAFAAGAVAVSAVAAGLAVLVPKHGMALSIVYLVIIDMLIGEIPASLQSISLTRQVRLLVGIYPTPSLVEPAITLATLAVVWLAIGMLRLRRLES